MATEKFTMGPFSDGSTQELDVQYGALPVSGAAPHTFGKPEHPQVTVALGAIDKPTPVTPPPPPPINPPPTCKTPPQMAGGNAIGNGIVCVPGSWANAATVDTQLLRNGVPIGTANQYTSWAHPYVIAPEDAGATFSPLDTAKNSAGQAASAVGSNKIVVASATPTPVTGTVPQISLPAGFAPITLFANLVKDYDFTGSKTQADWTPRTGTNDGMKVTQYEASQVQPGVDGMHLVAEHKTSPDGAFPYISGCLTTAGKFSIMHGLIQFRAKMPAGQGLWPGLWGHDGATETMELDVAELLLGNLRTVYGSAHQWNGWTHVWGETQSGQLASDATNFHDYQIVWQSGLVTWAIDGRAYAQYSQAQAQAAGHSWPFEKSMYLIAGIGVAAATEWGGAPNISTVFPAAMVVESVKAWQ